MNLETIKVIASLCSIVAGDTHQYGSTVMEIGYEQVKCHGFFVRCLKNSLLDACIEQRLKALEDKEHDALKKRERQ